MPDSESQYVRVAESRYTGGVADRDQLHAQALEIFRRADHFFLAAEVPDEGLVIVHALPDDETRPFLLAVINHARRLLDTRPRR